MVNKGIISCTTKGQIYGMASAFLFKIDSALSIYYYFSRKNIQYILFLFSLFLHWHLPSIAVMFVVMALFFFFFGVV